MAMSSVSSDKCANCGHPESEHHHSGACYGLCGKFVRSVEHVEPPALTGHAERQLDAVDASVFSGDCYLSSAGRARLRWYMARWSRQMDADEAADLEDNPPVRHEDIR